MEKSFEEECREAAVILAAQVMPLVMMYSPQVIECALVGSLAALIKTFHLPREEVFGGLTAALDALDARQGKPN